jgi:hypothetical protein
MAVGCGWKFLIGNMNDIHRLMLFHAGSDKAHPLPGGPVWRKNMNFQQDRLSDGSFWSWWKILFESVH